MSFSRILVVVYAAVAVVTAALSVSADGAGWTKVLTEGPPTDVLTAAGSLCPTRVVEEGEWWRLVNHTYLHGGLVHLLMNGLVLALCGPIAEVVYGRARFVVLYLLFGLGGATLSGLVHYDARFSAVGASGAIFGVLGILAVHGYRRQDAVGSSLLHRILFFLILNAVVAFSGADPRIDHWGHGGGLLTGLLLGVLLRPLEQRPRGEGSRAQVLGVVVILTQLVCLGIGGWNLWEGKAPQSRAAALADWAVYEENLGIVMHQQEHRDPTSMARDARALQSFSAGFSELADRLDEDGEDVAWLRRFVELQRELERQLRSQGNGARRRALAWQLRGQMAAAPAPWTRPHRFTEPDRIETRTPSEEVAHARHNWLHYWMNLAVLRTQTLSSAEREDAAETLDSYSGVFEDAATVLEDHEHPASWLRELIARQRALHDGLRGDQSQELLHSDVEALEEAMARSEWSLP